MLLSTEGWQQDKVPLANEFTEEVKQAIRGGDEKALIRLFRPLGVINKPFAVDGLTPLEYAADSGTDKIVQLLIDLGANILGGNIADAPLKQALNACKSDNVRVLLKNNAPSLSQKGESYLAVNTDETCIKILLAHIYEYKQEAQHNLVRSAGTLLWHTNYDVFRVLLEKITDQTGLVEILKSVIRFDADQVLEEVLAKITHVGDLKLLFLAIEDNATKVIPILCQSKLVNLKDCKEYNETKDKQTVKTMLSPLLVALMSKKYTTAKYLCTVPGIETNFQNEYFGTALTYVIDRVKSLKNRLELVNALLSNDLTDASLCDEEGNTPLDLAIGAEDLDLVNALLPRIKKEFSFPKDKNALWRAVDPFEKGSLPIILQALLRHSYMNANWIVDNESLLNHAVRAVNEALIKQLLARADVDVNFNLEPISTYLTKNTELLMPFLLHGGIDIKLLLHKQKKIQELSDNFKRVYAAQINFAQAMSKNVESEIAQFQALILAAYQECPVVVHNRVVHMIWELEQNHVSAAMQKTYFALIISMLNFPVNDAVYKALAFKIGEFIYTRPEDFAHRLELTVLFLLHSPDNNSSMLNSALFKLAGMADKYSARLQLSELLNDKDLRIPMLTALAKANHYRVLSLNAKPAMRKAFVELYYKDNPDACALMWDITQLHATNNAISKETREQDVASIVAEFEQFISEQSFQMKSPEIPALARSLSAALQQAEVIQPSSPPKMEI
ncbi:MAG: hypothetical protein M3R00_02685 [Pseudomonadota bacterium]|nr:hypothetical protein [Pseudomonadota bacterium]